MARSILATVLGVATWIAVATTLNLVLRVMLPGYREAEPVMAFTLVMLVARLVLGGLASISAGAVCFAVARVRRPVQVLAVLLVLVFVPMHYGLWDRFPAWYHLVFLVSLAPLTLFGARLVARR